MTFRRLYVGTHGVLPHSWIVLPPFLLSFSPSLLRSFSPPPPVSLSPSLCLSLSLCLCASLSLSLSLSLFIYLSLLLSRSLTRVDRADGGGTRHCGYYHSSNHRDLITIVHTLAHHARCPQLPPAMWKSAASRAWNPTRLTLPGRVTSPPATWRTMAS